MVQVARGAHRGKNRAGEMARGEKGFVWRTQDRSQKSRLVSEPTRAQGVCQDKGRRGEGCVQRKEDARG